MWKTIKINCHSSFIKAVCVVWNAVNKLWYHSRIGLFNVISVFNYLKLVRFLRDFWLKENASQYRPIPGLHSLITAGNFVYTNIKQNMSLIAVWKYKFNFSYQNIEYINLNSTNLHYSFLADRRIILDCNRGNVIFHTCLSAKRLSSNAHT